MSKQTLFLIRILFIVVTAVTGWQIEERFTEFPPTTGIITGTIIGLLVVGFDFVLKGVSLRIFSSATFGLALGCIFATLFIASRIFDHVDSDVQWVIYLTLYLTFGYVGTMLALRSNKDEFSLIIPYVRFMKQDTSHEQIVVDTSVIIDGRIADICNTGFVAGTLVIPRFVLKELQQIADSSDSLKRNRGRRGLDILNKIQQNTKIEVKIHETEVPDQEDVDSKLVQLAKLLGAKVLTNDYNLNKIAELQHVKVLNINDLANALRPVVLSGEELIVRLAKEGKENDQAVGYLPDGTMVVVNQSRHLIGNQVNVVVTSVLQTSAGRMVFGELKANVAPRPSTRRMRAADVYSEKPPST